jgi:hypothetical protein
MLNYIKNFCNASAQTQFFVLNWIVYGLAIIITACYCYARLDFVRSYPTGPTTKQHQSPVKIEE